MANALDRDFVRSQAVLIGTWNYTYLTDVGAAEHSLNRMRSLLTSELCGWPPERVKDFSNPQKPGDLPLQLVRLFASAKDVALFYFVGHGQIDDEDSLCLVSDGQCITP